MLGPVRSSTNRPPRFHPCHETGTVPATPSGRLVCFIYPRLLSLSHISKLRSLYIGRGYDTTPMHLLFGSMGIWVTYFAHLHTFGPAGPRSGGRGHTPGSPAGSVYLFRFRLTRLLPPGAGIMCTTFNPYKQHGSSQRSVHRPASSGAVPRRPWRVPVRSGHPRIA